MLNLQIARAYLAATDSGIATRTWQDALQAVISSKAGGTQLRWTTAARDKAFAPLLPKLIIATSGETLLQVMRSGTVSTNV